MKPGSVVIKPGILGAEQVVLNGIDITDSVEGVSVLLQQGQPPLVRLGLKAGTDVGEIAGDGVVEVQPDGPDIERWLAGLDPHILESTVLERGVASEGGIMGEVLAVLREWAAGGSAP